MNDADSLHARQDDILSFEVIIMMNTKVDEIGFVQVGTKCGMRHIKYTSIHSSKVNGSRSYMVIVPCLDLLYALLGLC